VSGHDEDTVVMFTTDHGIAFPHMKCNLYDTGIGVSLIIKCPQNNMKGIALDSLVSHIDIFPTICDLAGINKPSWLQGVSMLPLLMGEKEEIREEIFAEVTYHAAYEPMRCIRTSRYKLIRLYDNYEKVIAVNVDDSPSKDFLVRYGFLNSRKQKEMLFDLYLDPVERLNIINDKKNQEVYKELSEKLNEWMKKTGDPILIGKVEKPDGAIVFRQNCLSASQHEIE
jgi:arylsulfatase A-like enzyme